MLPEAGHPVIPAALDWPPGSAFLPLACISNKEINGDHMCLAGGIPAAISGMGTLDDNFDGYMKLISERA